jgi:hypothetical protein
VKPIPPKTAAKLDEALHCMVDMEKPGESTETFRRHCAFPPALDGTPKQNPTPFAFLFTATIKSCLTKPAVGLGWLQKRRHISALPQVEPRPSSRRIH